MIGLKKIGFMLFVFWYGLLPEVQATNNQFHSISGIVINDSTNQKIVFAHIFNESKRIGTIADRAGNFSIPASKGDTLIISALGFLGHVSFIPDSTFLIQIRMLPQKYEIEEVQVKAFKNYADFQRQFLALELPKTETDHLREYLHKISREVAVESYEKEKTRRILENQNGLSLSTSVPLFSRNERQLMNLAKVMRTQEKQRIVNQKYNRELVAKVTNLEDEELTDFIFYCNFDIDLLFHISEYDILVMIEKKFLEYRLLNTIENPVQKVLQLQPLA